MSTEKNINLSIIIVTYNSGSFIEKCLLSIKENNPLSPCEVIIVDNASTDDTTSLVNSFIKDLTDQKDNSYILIQNRENAGYAAANNQALRLAKGGYIMLLNPDTELMPNSTSILKSYLETHPDTAITAPQMLNPHGEIQPSCRNFPDHLSLLFEITGLSYLFKKNSLFNRWKMGYFDHEELMEVNQPMGSCIMIKRKAFEDVGYMDEQFEMFFNDVDWCRRFKEQGWKIVFIPDAKVKHYSGSSINMQKPEMIFKSHQGFYRYFKKYYRKLWYLPLNAVAGIILLISAPVRVIFYKLKFHNLWKGI